MKFHHTPGPWPAEEPEPQAEFHAGFEDLGFRLLGAAMRVEPTDAQVAQLAAGYAQDDREQFLAWAGRPNQVLAAPDGTAFVRLGWFWSGDYAEVVTVLPDGTMVTTTAEWGIDPAWPKQIRRWYAATTDRLREQELWSSPSSSSKVVAGTAADLWSAHRAHVLRFRGGEKPVTAHDQLPDAIAVFDATQACRQRSAGRATLVAAIVSFVLVATYLLVMNIAFRPSNVGHVLLVASGVVLVVVTQKQLWLRFRHWRWLRPRFRAPVPMGSAALNLDR